MNSENVSLLNQLVELSIVNAKLYKDFDNSIKFISFSVEKNMPRVHLASGIQEVRLNTDAPFILEENGDYYCISVEYKGVVFFQLIEKNELNSFKTSYDYFDELSNYVKE